MGDIHGARVTPSGITLDTMIVISDTTVKASPTVAYGAGVYLVSWTDNRTVFSDIYCARILPDGTVLDVGGFPLSPDSGYQTGSKVVFDGTNFFVAWSSYEEAVFSLQGARVSPGGVVVDSTPILISQGSSSKFGPGLAFDGSNYMLQWDDSRLNPPEYDQWVARVTPQGEVVDSNGIPVDTSSGNQYNNDLGFLGSGYLACWCDYSTGEGDLYGRRIGTDGIWIDTIALTVCNATGNQETPRVFQDTEKFIVAWKDSRNGVTNADLYAVFIDSATVGLEEVTNVGVRAPSFSIIATPNPFVERVHIDLCTGAGGGSDEKTELIIFDAAGREVRELIFPSAHFPLPSGVCWDGCDDGGKMVPPGIYFLVLKTGGASFTEKVLKIR